jgi:hypothetical protein
MLLPLKIMASGDPFTQSAVNAMTPLITQGKGRVGLTPQYPPGFEPPPASTGYLRGDIDWALAIDPENIFKSRAILGGGQSHE